MENINDIDFDSQTHLKPEWIKLLEPKYDYDDSIFEGRPKNHLIDLMHWVKDTFGPEIINHDIHAFYEDLNDIYPWIHNKIVIDGDFLYFAEQNNIEVQCLYRDSATSWNTDTDFEHFLAQGVFKISYGDLVFLHAALFSKASSYEDEVSFFVIVRDSKFEQYVQLRNKYNQWLIERDRSHLEIAVIGGEGQPYTRDCTWDDIFLPEKLKNDIKGTVEGFLAAEDIYKKARIPWKRGIIFYGSPGLGKTSVIRTIISSYNFKPVTVQSSTQTNDDVISEAFSYAQEQNPALLYIEDLDTLVNQNISLPHLLNLMDGVSSKNGVLVIATANDLSRLGDAILDRPSRFDRKWEFPLPDKSLCKKYLQKWFGDAIKTSDLNKFVNRCIENKFSYAYLKEIYITAAYCAISEGRDKPNAKDAERALVQILEEKDRVRSGFESEDSTEIGIS